MKHIEFKKKNYLIMQGVWGHTVSEAVIEAVEFANENNIEIKLECNGHTFDINPTTDTQQKLNEYFGL